MMALKWFLIGWMSGGFAMGALMLIDVRRLLMEGKLAIVRKAPEAPHV